MTDAPWSIISSIAPASSFGSKSAIPDDPAFIVAMCEYLYRCVVMRQPSPDCGPGQAANSFVEIDNQLSQHHSVPERYDACAWLQPGINHEARHEPLMEGANISNCRPGVFGASLGQNLFLDKSHNAPLGPPD